MAGTAFLPWEKWATRFAHWLAVVITRTTTQFYRRWYLSRSRGWPETVGTIERVNSDISLPRDEIEYSYSAKQERYSGHHYRWFGSATEQNNATEGRVGNKIVLRYQQEDPAKSVFLRFS